MQTITDKLAAALRAATPHARSSATYSGSDDSAAVEALAEYDAQPRDLLDRMADALNDVLKNAHSVPVGDAFDRSIHSARATLAEYEAQQRHNSPSHLLAGYAAPAGDHTAEPWEAGTRPPHVSAVTPVGRFIRKKDGDVIAVISEGSYVRASANARRIVACINACAGIPTDALERLPTIGGGLSALRRCVARIVR